MTEVFQRPLEKLKQVRARQIRDKGTSLISQFFKNFTRPVNSFKKLRNSFEKSKILFRKEEFLFLFSL